MKTKLKTVLLYVVLGGLLLAIGGYGGWRAYKSTRQARLVQQARDHLAKPDPRKALLCLQRALKYNSRDVEACRLMAQLAEASRSPAALVWRARVVELDPASTDDRLALARTALAARDFASATNALEGVNAAGKKTAGYHNIAGSVNIAAGQAAPAEAHFVEAVRLEPQNAVLQLNLAVVRLHGSNAPAAASARSALQHISANPTNDTLRCLALRELSADAARRKQFDAALALSRRLLQETNSVFRDRLLQLDVLRAARSTEYKPTLATFQRAAASDPGNTAELALWQMANTTPAETVTWLHSLPPGTRTNQAVAMVTAECQLAMRDWRGMQTALESQNWGELEFTRHAFMARALRGQELAGAAKGEWELALKTANHQKGSLMMLLRMAAAWNWQSEAEEILWSIVNRYPNEPWAFQTLSQALFLGGRTRPLMMLYSQQLKRAPTDLGIKNNLAMTALLLEAAELKPHELAREVYEKSRTNAAFASTYALSLHLQNKNADALKVMQTLSPAELDAPSNAGYYGLVLKATGSPEKAKAYLNAAFKAPMLPEERKLFQRAQQGI